MATKRKRKRAKRRKGHARKRAGHKRKRRHAPRPVQKRRRRRKARRKGGAVSRGTWTCRNCRCLCVNRSKCWGCGCAKSECAA